MVNNKQEQVASAVSRKFLRRRSKRNQFLPSEQELCRQFNVSRITVRNGLKILKRRNLIESCPGKGYRIVSYDTEKKRENTGLIGAVFAGVEGHSVTGILMEHASASLEKSGYHMVFTSSKDNPCVEREKIESLLAKKVAGILLVPSFVRNESLGERHNELGNYHFVKEIYESGTPLVLLDRSFPESGIPGVCNDEEQGGYLATKHLLKRGHERILYLSMVIDRIGNCRLEGYQRAMTESSLPPSTYLLDYSFYRRHGLETAALEREMKNALESNRKASALVLNGKFAQIAQRIMASPSYSGPQVQVIGYDVSPEGTDEQYRYPYMKRPIDEIGRRAAKKIVDLINQDPDAEKTEFLKPELIE